MTTLDAAFLGVIQGFTEFLPISSSGHLVLAQSILGIQTPDISLEIVTHLGTLLSIVIIFRYDILMMIKGFFRFFRSEGRKDNPYGYLAMMIIIGTIPAVIVGGLFKDFLEGLFKEPGLVGFTLIITGLVLWFTKYKKESLSGMTGTRALLIGMAQAVAIIPGISRSGTTISLALYMGIDRTEAAHFSFFLAVPAILGASVLEVGDLVKSGVSQEQLLTLGTGLICAFFTGYLAIKALLRILRSNRFHFFAPYCIAVGILALILV